LVAQLHEKIGELTVELDWLKKKVTIQVSMEPVRTDAG
jgi:hypothetical protein